MNEPAYQALRDAVDRNQSAILLMPATGAGEARRTRLLGTSGGDLWIESPPKQQALAETLQRSGKPVAITFRSNEHIVSFRTIIRSFRLSYELSPGTAVQAIGLAWPAEIEMTQRRAGYRAKVTMDARIESRAWPIDELAIIEQVPAALPWTADLRDLSVNGMGLILRAGKGVTPQTQIGDRMRVEVSTPDRRLVVGCRVRQELRRLPDGSVRVGLNFEGVDQTIEGRRTLSQIAQLVAELQRLEVRRRRAG